MRSLSQFLKAIGLSLSHPPHPCVIRRQIDIMEVDYSAKAGLTAEAQSHFSELREMLNNRITKGMPSSNGCERPHDPKYLARRHRRSWTKPKACINPSDKMRLESARGLGQFRTEGRAVRECGSAFPSIEQYNKAIQANRIIGHPIVPLA